MKENSFGNKLLAWHHKNKIPHPWKSTNDPYKIWLSEIIMQQTRIEQGTPYYLKFVNHFPDVFSLAKAKEEKVLKLWQGLGYYSRARNLHTTAKFIVENDNGIFPKEYNEVLKLKGIGEYTAAAICSFAYNQKYAVVDGNVERVLSRIYGIQEDIKSSPMNKQLKQLAHQLLAENEPALFNQAIMDFGANQCTPKKPKCESCPFNEDCVALKQDIVSQLPYKAKKIKKKKRFFSYYVFNTKDELILRKRADKDIWQGLYDFPCRETETRFEDSDEAFLNGLTKELGGKIIKKDVWSEPKKQLLSHRIIYSRFQSVQLEAFRLKPQKPYLKVNKTKINDYAFPKTVDLYLSDKTITLYSKE